MRCVILALSAISCFGFQNPAAPPAGTLADEIPVFRTGARLVQVDVVVRGKDAPIEGLTKEDFEVADNGKKQLISVFSVRREQKSQKPPAPLAPGVVTNRPLQTGPEPVSATIILMDHLNAATEDQAFAQQQALKYIQQTTNAEQIAIYSLNWTLKVVQNFTADRDMQLQALKKASAEPPAADDAPDLGGRAALGAAQAANARKVDTTSAAFKFMAQQLGGLPGRKKLVWITSGLPIRIAEEGVPGDFNPSEYGNLNPQLFAAMRMLNGSNVSLYAIDPRGAKNAGLADPNLDTMRTLAALTGGKAFYGDNGIAKVIESAMNDTDLTYTLGFYQPEGSLDGAFHSISVKVLRTRPAARSIQDVRYRRSYNAEQPRKPLTERQRTGTLNLLVNEPLDFTELGIQAMAKPAKNKAGYYDVTVLLDPAGLQLTQKNNRWVGLFEVAIAADVKSKPKGLHQVIKVNLTAEGYAAALTSGILVKNQVRVTNEKGKPLSKLLHLVVMDSISGKAGSVRMPIGD